MRKIAEDVHTKCSNSGIAVPCESFDGQWHNLVVRSSEGKPLTILQLQKDAWKEVEKKRKPDLLSELKGRNRSPQWSLVDEGENEIVAKKYINVTGYDRKLPVYRPVNKVAQDNNEIDMNVVDDTNLASVIPEIVQGVLGAEEDVLAMSQITDSLEMESFTSNVSDEVWSDELERITSAGEETQKTAETLNVDHNIKDESRPPKPVLSEADIDCILALLKTTNNCNKTGKWEFVSSTCMLNNFKNREGISNFLDTELRIIIRYLRKTKGLNDVKESSNKKIKIDGLSKFFQFEQTAPESVKMGKSRVTTCKSLKETAFKIVSKYKQQLNIILSEYNWDTEYKNWLQNYDSVTLNGETCEWFYIPEYSQARKQFEVKCIDSTHLLTRMRRKSCRGGMEGLTNNSWEKVAKQKLTLLTPIMVDEVTDPMSVSMAKTHFSEAVEFQMRKNGDNTAADLCNDIRNWWESEDSPGISSTTRVHMRAALRSRLLSHVNFTRFPPSTQYIAGWPLQLWEALIASIDAKTYLFSLVHGGAFSSLIGETFFSELTLNDKRGQGTVTAREFGQYVGTATEQLQIRLDNDRSVAYCTSKSKVYDVVDESYESSHHDNACRVCVEGLDRIPRNICTRDHPFDSVARMTLPGQRKESTVSLERNAVMKGTLGVRCQKARRDDFKVLTTKRMGLE